MPRIIPQDKERLYSEALSLKTKINTLTLENTQLKTKNYQMEVISFFMRTQIFHNKKKMKNSLIFLGFYSPFSKFCLLIISERANSL